MSCILCLETPNDPTVNACMHSTKEQVQCIVEHFWRLELDATVISTSFICKQCWQATLVFHDFYLRVQDAHKLQQETIINTNDVLNSSFDVSSQLKLEELDIKPEPEVLGENAVKRKRGRPRRQQVQNIKYELRQKRVPPLIMDQMYVPEAEIKQERTVATKNDVLANNSDEEQSYVNEDLVSVTSDQEQQEDKLIAGDNLQRHNSKYKMRVTRQYDEYIATHFKLNCCICQEPQPNFAVLKSHFRAQHKTYGYVLCCGKKFLKRGVLVDHIHLHQDPLYFKCTLCEKILASRRCLEIHQKLHEGKRERIHQCEVCSKRFFRRCVFLRHILLHVPEDQKNVTCPQCDKTFATDYLMSQHLKLVHLNVYVKICDICGKSIRGREALRRHQEEHAGVPRESCACEICGVTLTTKYGLSRHIKVMHTDEFQQPQTCAICSKVSPNLTAHKRHISYMHSMKRKHLCPMCDKAFKRAPDLREHMTTHTGEVLYTCPHCPKTFNSNANMHSHRKKVHRKEWEERRMQKYPKKQQINHTTSTGNNSTVSKTLVSEYSYVKH